MKMGCFIEKQMVMWYIFNSLSQMQKNMEVQENGLCILKIQQLSPPPALQNGPQSSTKGNGTNQQPPGTPRLPRRTSLTDDFRGRLFPPHRKTLTFDLEEEENNKENYPPQLREEEQYSLNFYLTQLLETLEHDIDLLHERVSRDFSAFKSKLGIRRS
uniref:E4 protein n=1 Tax=Human papillomavirus TaxID=10566 RepID=A0A385PK69_9PAPI|nr:MAG: E4 protein [Human papillomavirus]